MHSSQVEKLPLHLINLISEPNDSYANLNVLYDGTFDSIIHNLPMHLKLSVKLADTNESLLRT